MGRYGCWSCVVACLLLAAGCDVDDPDWIRRHVQVTGSGVMASESRSVAPFRALTVTGPFQVSLHAGAVASLELTAEDNVLPLVQTEVRNGRLEVFLAFGGVSTKRGMTVRITSPGLHEIEGTAAAQIEADGFAAESLTTRLSGASSLVASGRADRHELHLSGASRCRAENLQTRRTVASLSGASYGLVRASETLVADVSGASTLEYLGDPELESRVSGTGSVRRVGP